MGIFYSLFGSSKKAITDTTKNATTSQTINPWGPSQAGLLGITGGVEGLLGNTMPTGTEMGALDAMTQNALRGDPFAGAKANLATDLYGGGADYSGLVNNAYSQYQSSLNPYATGSTNPYDNEAFTKFTTGLSNDITDQIKSQYAGAGYSGVSTGDFGKQLGEGISRGVAPTWLQATNDLEARKLGAINSLYGAGNQTAGILGNMDQTRFGNRMSALGVGDAALAGEDYGNNQLLAIEAARRGIPTNQLAALTKIAYPVASLGRTGTGTEQGTQHGVVTEEGSQSPFAALAGLGIAGLGFMGGKSPFGGLLGNGSSVFSGMQKNPNTWIPAPYG